MGAVLEFANVGFAVPRTAILKDVSFTVQSGEAVFISGKSGAGKSTLLKLAAGIQYQTSGDIFIQGVSLKAANNAQLLELHAQSGYLFQDSALISNMTIFDNLALPLRYHNLGTEYEIRQRVEGLLDRMDLMED
ncbi:MAG: ATP-binding cassette domain-containing protein, partial [Spirochaetia bacterium]|nr:ATP-binding cassette domain-containing protein [Spirochaetia bacterium]